MADLDVTRALSFLGKRFNAVVCWPDCEDGPHLTNGLCVGVVIPAANSAVALQLLVHRGDASTPEGGYHFEVFWHTVRSIFPA